MPKRKPILVFLPLHIPLKTTLLQIHYHLCFWCPKQVYADLSLIEALEDGYEVLQPIPVKFSMSDDATVLAEFEEANIAMSGTDWQDAYQSLVAEILDTFDALVSEANLSPAAADQLEVLKSYIDKA